MLGCEPHCPKSRFSANSTATCCILRYAKPSGLTQATRVGAQPGLAPGNFDFYSCTLLILSLLIISSVVKFSNSSYEILDVIFAFFLKFSHVKEKSHRFCVGKWPEKPKFYEKPVLKKNCFLYPIPNTKLGNKLVAL